MIRLITIGPTDLNYSHLQWFFEQHFKFEMYTPNGLYNKDSCIFIVSRPEQWNDNIIHQYLDQGYRLILANLWEARPYFLADKFSPYLNNILLLLGCSNSFNYGWPNRIDVPQWFWYNEHLWYTCDQRIRENIGSYVPNRSNTKLFLMPIQRSKKFRDQIVDRLTPLLDRAIWSYVEQWGTSQSLPRYTWSPFERTRPDRIFESEWYDQTYFTVVVETAVNRLYDMTKETSGLRSEDYPCDLFVTEKTFKPIAFRHPFLVCGMPGTLEFLRNLGFETYENIFDESYDKLEFFDDRLELVYNDIKNFDTTCYNDSVTKQKIKHNYDHFNNRSLVLAGLTTNLIEPMLEWINAT